MNFSKNKVYGLLENNIFGNKQKKVDFLVREEKEKMVPD